MYVFMYYLSICTYYVCMYVRTYVCMYVCIYACIMALYSLGHKCRNFRRKFKQTNKQTSFYTSKHGVTLKYKFLLLLLLRYQGPRYTLRMHRSLQADFSTLNPPTPPKFSVLSGFRCQVPTCPHDARYLSSKNCR